MDDASTGWRQSQAVCHEALQTTQSGTCVHAAVADVGCTCCKQGPIKYGVAQRSGSHTPYMPFAGVELDEIPLAAKTYCDIDACRDQWQQATVAVVAVGAVGEGRLTCCKYTRRLGAPVTAETASLQAA